MTKMLRTKEMPILRPVPKEWEQPEIPVKLPPVPPMWDRGHARDGYGSSDHPIHDDSFSDGHDTYC